MEYNEVERKLEEIELNNDIKKNYTQLLKICELIKEEDNYELYSELIQKNIKLQTIIKNIIINKKLLNNILNSDNNRLISFLEVYASMNNVELYEDTEQIDDVYANKDVGLDSLEMYLREISKIPLLTPEQEKEYFTRLKNGEQEYAKKIIEANLRLVIKFANKFVNKGLSKLDLIQEGNLGLMKAVEKFDIEKGTKFSTYATWWIRQNITRAIHDTARKIRIPVHIIEKMPKFNAIYETYLEKEGRAPSYEEMSILIGESIELTKRMFLYRNDASSLNDKVGEEEDTELELLIPSDYSLEETVVNRMADEEILKKLDCLNYREKRIVLGRCGIITGEIETLESLGEMFNITRERVRQIEAKALRRLKHLNITGTQTRKVKQKELPLTLYYFLQTNNKSLVLSIVNNLSLESIKLLKLAFGPNLDYPIRIGNLNRYQKNTILNTIIPKIKTQLTQPIEDKKNIETDDFNNEIKKSLALMLTSNFGDNNA